MEVIGEAETRVIPSGTERSRSRRFFLAEEKENVSIKHTAG